MERIEEVRPMKIESGQSLLFTGDSITDCGRSRPIGKGPGLGDGYVAMVGRFLSERHADRGLTVLNTGISGNTVTDLRARWGRDVLDVRPDWLSVMIGINDVWRLVAGNLGAVPIDLYEDTYRTLLEPLRPALAGLVLMTPYVIELNRSDPMRVRMDEYGAVVQRLADEFDALFVNLQATFDDYSVDHPGEYLSSDRVHPNPTGHKVIALAFLGAMGFD